jgi:hypothetical protein
MPDGAGTVAGAWTGAEVALTAGSKGTIETIESDVAGRAEVIGVRSADQAAVAASAADGTPPAKVDSDAGPGAGTVIN